MLFIELDELDENLLKKAVLMIREKLEGAVEASVEVIDVDSPNTISNARIQTETTNESKQGTPAIESSDSPTAAAHTHTHQKSNLE